jgi:hypothetical protein
MEQTAVNWLIEQFRKSGKLAEFSPILQQAKEMERQQIADAYDYEADDDMHDYSSGEQYYDQTFL